MYRRKFHTPLNCSQLEEKLILGLVLLQEMEQTLHRNQQNIKAAQERQKNYADKKIKNIGNLKSGSCIFESETPKGNYAYRNLSKTMSMVLWSM